MKKEYITPQIKSITLQPSGILAGSDTQLMRFDPEVEADPEEEVL